MIQLNRYNLTGNAVERELMLKTTSVFNHVQGVHIKTCNRYDLYSGNGLVEEWIVRHLFRVVSGLESKFIGEMSIQCQVKESYLMACQKYNLDKNIHKLFQNALHIGKEVRTKTLISKGAVSHWQATDQIISNSFCDLKDKKVTLVGINKMNENILQSLSKKGVSTIILCNRNLDKAKEIALKNNIEAYSLHELRACLKTSDILISSTSAPHLIIKKDDISMDKKMLIIDLAVPRDIDPIIAYYKNITLYSIDEIENYVEQSLDKRKGEIVKAEIIIENGIKNFMMYQNKLYTKTFAA